MNESVSGVTRMAEARAMLGMSDVSASSAQCIDRIQRLSRLKAEIAALEMTEIAELEHHRYAAEDQRGVPCSRRGYGLAVELGLGTSQSPARGALCLQTARVLSQDMPKTFDALALVQLDQERAQAVVKVVSWFEPQHRSEIDVL